MLSETIAKEVTKEREIVSLFSGAVDLTWDFSADLRLVANIYKRLPNKITWANDNNPAACRTYEENIGKHIICGDISDCLNALPTEVDILIGGFPCQDVSVNGKGNVRMESGQFFTRV